MAGCDAEARLKDCLRVTHASCGEPSGLQAGGPFVIATLGKRDDAQWKTTFFYAQPKRGEMDVHIVSMDTAFQPLDL